MDATKTYITVYGITADHAQDFEFDYDVNTSDVLTELVPDLDNWGGVGWMERLLGVGDAVQVGLIPCCWYRYLFCASGNRL